VEQQLFAGAGAGAIVFYPSPAPEPGIKIFIKCYKNPKFIILKFEVDFNITIWLLLTLKNHLMIIYVFKKMKIC
jgi:hypothetical protein